MKKEAILLFWIILVVIVNGCAPEQAAEAETKIEEALQEEVVKEELTLENCNGQECIDVCKEDLDACEAFCKTNKEKCPQEVKEWYISTTGMPIDAPEEAAMPQPQGMPQGFPQGSPDPDAMLQQICATQEFPPDCSMIPFAQGQETCRKCKQMTSESPLPTKQTDDVDLTNKSSLPILLNIGVNIDDYSPTTKKAGDFVFKDTDDNYQHKIFLEFAVELCGHDGCSGLPSLNYVLPLDVMLFSPVSGEVDIVRYQERDDDYEIGIIPDGFPKWRVYFDHVVNIKVEEGDVLQAGDFIGTATPWAGLGNDRGFVELQVEKVRRQMSPQAVCPVILLDDAVREDLENKIREFAKDWEDFVERDVYDEGKWVAPGCLAEMSES